MTIVAAVDTNANAEQIITEGVELSTFLGGDLHVIHVRKYSELKQNVEADAGIDRRSVKQQIENEAARLASAITDEFTPVGLIGQPASEIISYADSQNAAYIVIGGRKQSPIGKAVFGSTAQQILLNAPCPVVTTMIPSE